MKKYRLSNQIRNRKKYKIWVEEVSKNANYTCEGCGLVGHGGFFQVHHKKSFTTILLEKNITTVSQAFECKELWVLDGAEYLCSVCHQTRHGFYGGK